MSSCRPVPARGMIKRHYPEVFEKDAAWLARARALAAKTHELMSFLVKVRGMTPVSTAQFAKAVCYHDSCSSLREMGVNERTARAAGLASRASRSRN